MTRAIINTIFAIYSILNSLRRPPFRQWLRWIRTLGIVIGVIGLLDSASGQISNSEESARYLADHIASSSGGDPEQYLDYARGLAKTLSGLSLERQADILGFVPALPEFSPGSDVTDTPPEMPDETSPGNGDENGDETTGDETTGDESGSEVVHTSDPAMGDGSGEEGGGLTGTGGGGGATSGGSTGATGSQTGGSTTDGEAGDGGSGGVLVVVTNPDSGGGGTVGVVGLGGVGSAGGTDACSQLDGTPLNVSYPAANTNAENAVIADAVRAYWGMTSTAHEVLSQGTSRSWSQDSQTTWGYHGAAVFSSTKTASELQLQLDSMYAGVENQLANWLAANGGTYPSVWPPTLPPVENLFWSSPCP